MKKFIKILCLSVAVIMLASQTMFAAELMMMYGKTDSDASQVTLLVLDADIADRANITPSQIKYIDQSGVDENGNFSIILPFFDTNDYSVYSNLDFNIVGGEEKLTAYVSANGSDSNSGFSADEPFKSLEKAYLSAEMLDEIVLLDDTVYTEAPAHSGMLTIKGNTQSVKLTLPAEVSLKGDLTIDNVLISGKSSVYANGHKLKITETVTSDAGNGSSASGKALSVYGGKKNADLTGNTFLELLGGKYYRVYGGCQGGDLIGNSVVIFGGNANSGDGINDQNTSTCSLCYVYGGGENGAVTGEASVTIQDNAVSKFVCGAGNGTYGTAKTTSIYINGGKVMNVYGGSTNTTLTNCDTNVIMKGGLVEAIFGGSEKAPMTGNAYITLIGGEISRRVYSGCYNEYELLGAGWKSHNFITGTTNLVIYPEAKIATGTGLEGINNNLDKGIGIGSRDSSSHNEEVNTVIFLNDSYSSNKNKIGALYGNHADYTVKATKGGTVEGTKTGGKVKITPDNGYYTVIGNNEYEKGEVAISAGTTDVTFKKKNFFIYDVKATKGENKADGTANVNADNSTANEISPTLYVSVFEFETGELIDCAVSEATTGQKSFSLNCKFEEGKRYIIKAMMWNGNMEPLTSVYSIELK